MGRTLITFAIFFLGLSGQGIAAYQDQEEEPAPTPVGRSGLAVENLTALLARRAGFEAELKALRGPAADGEILGEITGEPLSDQEKAEREIELRAEIEALDHQISAVATGVSDSDFTGSAADGFDLNGELESLVEPFVVMMKDATENARQIERLRRSLSDARRREGLATRALERLGPVREAASDPALAETLTEMDAEWRNRQQSARELGSALDQQLGDRIAAQRDSRSAVNDAASGFFRDRGLSIVYGLGSFALVFMLLRLLKRVIDRVRERRKGPRGFAERLFDLAYSAFALVAAVGAMLVVFNLRSDWLLLGAFGVVLIALIWTGLKMIPSAMEQVTLLLNLGAVQEGERLLMEGVPFRVKRLDIYAQLENPALDGGSFIVPVRQLIGHHSRPSGPGEPWFPTQRGDWVLLEDGTRGQIVTQSPELVEVRVAGGSRVTLTTVDFLAGKPKNLSDGYRAEISFGISYNHQSEAVSDIMGTLEAHVSRGIGRLVGDDALRGVSVEILEAADSAIVYEVEADVTGSAAPKMEAIERELMRLCVEACNVHGWEIPFPQIVMHKV